jgi:hypothetical protein
MVLNGEKLRPRGSGMDLGYIIRFSEELLSRSLVHFGGTGARNRVEKNIGCFTF